MYRQDLEPTPKGSAAKKADHPVQSLMSRTGSFPLGVALTLVRRHTAPSSIVLDPFCGKGTTLLASRMLGHAAYGIDIAPEAVICAAAKMADVTTKSIGEYIAALPSTSRTHEKPPPEVRTFFHDETLEQILDVRAALEADLRSKSATLIEHATFTLGCLLGILHGHAAYSLSISSAHAFAMAPRYVERYAREHELTAPVRDVKACITTKAKQCLATPLPRSVPNRILWGSAIHCRTLLPSLAGRVNLIVTSPPYLNAQTYAKDNWLRLWLLRQPYKEIQHRYLQTGSVRRYAARMAQKFVQLESMLAPGGKLFCIAGDIRVRPSALNGKRSAEPSVLRLGELLANTCARACPRLKIADYDFHVVKHSTRYLHAINQTNGHRSRDLIERIFVAEKR